MGGWSISLQPACSTIDISHPSILHEPPTRRLLNQNTLSYPRSATWAPPRWHILHRLYREA